MPPYRRRNSPAANRPPRPPPAGIPLARVSNRALTSVVIPAQAGIRRSPAPFWTADRVYSV